MLFPPLNMWTELVKAIGNISFLGEQSRRNAEDIIELRRRIEGMAIDIERLNHKIERNRENEAHEREKLMLRIEKLLLAHQNAPTKAAPKQLKKKRP